MKSEMSSRGVLKAEELDCIAYMSVGEEEGGGGDASGKFVYVVKFSSEIVYMKMEIITIQH